MRVKLGFQRGEPGTFFTQLRKVGTTDQLVNMGNHQVEALRKFNDFAASIGMNHSVKISASGPFHLL